MTHLSASCDSRRNPLVVDGFVWRCEHASSRSDIDLVIVREKDVRTNKSRVERLIEVPEDVFDIFQSDTQTDEIRADAGRKLFCFG